MPAKLTVVPTSRARRERSAEYRIAHKILTMEEFESRLVYAKDRVLVDEIARFLALKSASDRLKNSEILNIQKNFLAFLDHAPFFLKFFDELSLEGVEIDLLLEGDYYAEYDQQIAILKELKKLYFEELAKKSYADRGFLAENQLYNLSWLSEFDELSIEIEGALTKFEIDILKAVSEVLPTTIEIAETPFDKQIIDSLKPLENSVKLQRKECKLNGIFRTFCVQERLEQIAAISCEIFYYIDEKKIAPEKIAVVLPDEQFAEYMQRLDRYELFNYAMGFSFTKTKFYRLLNAIAESETETLAKMYLDRIKFPSDLRNSCDLGEIINNWADDKEKPIAKECLDEIKPILESENLNANETIRLYLRVLAQKSFDDYSGGKITVLGALETRLVAFDAVIVADFNDEIVPHKSEKDLFLNAAVRSRAGLPNYADRADNERGVYFRLFSRAKYITIFAVQNDAAKPSRFIKEIDIKTPIAPYVFDRELFFPRRTIKRTEEKAIELEIDLTKEALSASKLKTYLTCKRQFFYRYIKSLKESDLFDERSIALDFGAILHNALAKGRERAEIIEILRSLAKDDLRLSFEAALWETKLEFYFKNEEIRKAEGWQTIANEIVLSCNYNGVLFNGRIDRIDQNSSSDYLVIDYKTGKLPENPKNIDMQRDFQLLIYRLLCEANGYSNPLCAYYDLQNCKIVSFDTSEYLGVFENKLDEYKNRLQNFEKTGKKRDCRNCSFTILCEQAQ